MHPWVTSIAGKPRRWAGSKTAVPARQVDETHDAGVGLGNSGCVWRGSEISVTRVGLWSGEGSVGAACRNMEKPPLRALSTLSGTPQKTFQSRAVFSSGLQWLRVNCLQRPAIRTPIQKLVARPSAMANLSFRSGLPNRPLPPLPIATFALSLMPLPEVRMAWLRKAFDHLPEGGC